MNITENGYHILKPEAKGTGVNIDINLTYEGTFDGTQATMPSGWVFCDNTVSFVTARRA